MPVGFALTNTVTDPGVPTLRAIKGNRATNRAGVVTRGCGKPRLTLPAKAPRAKSPSAVRGPGHHHHFAGRGSLAPEGPRNVVHKVAKPVIPVRTQATPTRLLRAIPVGPRPEPGPAK
jgi:hypothetical protein